MLKNIPDQDKPLFDFYIDQDGNIQKTAHVKYIVQQYQTGMGTKIRYMICKTSNVVTKTPNQLDKYLSGHFFTFIDNESRARSAMIGYYQNKLELAEQAVAQSKTMLDLLQPGGTNT